MTRPNSNPINVKWDSSVCWRWLAPPTACWRFRVTGVIQMNLSSIAEWVRAWVGAGEASREVNRWRHLVSMPDSNLSLVSTASRTRHMPGALQTLHRDMKVGASWDRTCELLSLLEVCSLPLPSLRVCFAARFADFISRLCDTKLTPTSLLSYHFCHAWSKY